jgi:hypothetical protein
VQLIELLQFLIVRSHGESLMEEEMCLVDSCVTNSILRETKYFHTITRRSGNILTIAGRDAKIDGFGRATITFPNGTQVTIEDALLYLDSTHTLISFRDIRRAGYMYISMKTTKRNFSLLLSLLNMPIRFKKEFLLLRLDCTTHTLNPYHMLHTR